MAGLLALQLGLVIIALCWLALLPAAGTPTFVGQAVSAGLFLAGLGLAGVWVWPPRWMLIVVGTLYLLLVLRAHRRGGARPLRMRAMVTLVPSAVLSAAGVVLLWQGIAGRLQPDIETLDLANPLRGEGSCAVSAGDSMLLNFHRLAWFPPADRLRGDSHGVDFVRIGPSGLRTVASRWWSPAPADPHAYLIFGQPVYAPCAGRVIRARDDLPDQGVGEVDRRNLPGNHVVLACDGYEVLLAHFRHGSLTVSSGQQVAVGQRLAAVGNTGNSAEPHLHLSAQRQVPAAERMQGGPVAVTFRGRYLARHGCLSNSASD